MKKIFFAFLNELDHSKQFFKKVGKMIFFWLPPSPLLGKIPDNSGLFLRDAFPYRQWKQMDTEFFIDWDYRKLIVATTDWMTGNSKKVK